MQSQLATRNELDPFKGEVTNMMRNKLGVDMGTTRLYQKPYRPILIMWLFPLDGICLILLNLVLMTTTQPGNTLAYILLI
jgi:hypothetical protein